MSELPELPYVGQLVHLSAIYLWTGFEWREIRDYGWKIPEEVPESFFSRDRESDSSLLMVRTSDGSTRFARVTKRPQRAPEWFVSHGHPLLTYDGPMVPINSILVSGEPMRILKWRYVPSPDQICSFLDL